MYINILYVVKIITNVCMDDGNLTRVDPFPCKALQQVISFCMERGRGNAIVKLHVVVSANGYSNPFVLLLKSP